MYPPPYKHECECVYIHVKFVPPTIHTSVKVMLQFCGVICLLSLDVSPLNLVGYLILELSFQQCVDGYLLKYTAVYQKLKERKGLASFLF